MAQLGEMTLDELRVRVRRLLNVPDAATGQWGDDRLTQDVNLAILWLQGRLSHFQHYWRSVRTGPFAITVGVIPWPDDMLIERRLLKRTSATPERFEEVEVITAEQVDGVSNSATRRERWTTQERSFRFVGTDFTAGTYDLDYIQNIPKLQAATDVPKLPSQWHYAAAIRAAEVNSLEVGELERHVALVEQRKGIEAEIDAEALRFSGMRVREHTLKELKFGTFGYVRENVKQTLVSSGKKTPDYWNDARLSTIINNANQEMQIDLMALNPDIFLVPKDITVTGGVAPVPPDAVRVRMLVKMENGEPKVQTIVPLSQMFETMLAMPMVQQGSGLSVVTNQWTIEQGMLRSKIGSSNDGAYRLLYEPRLLPLVDDADPLQIPLEHTNALIAKAVSHGARLIGDIEFAALHAATYQAAMSGASSRVLQEKTQMKRHRIRETWGYSADDMDGAGEWWF